MSEYLTASQNATSSIRAHAASNRTQPEIAPTRRSSLGHKAISCTFALERARQEAAGLSGLGEGMNTSFFFRYGVHIGKRGKLI